MNNLTKKFRDPARNRTWILSSGDSRNIHSTTGPIALLNRRKSKYTTPLGHKRIIIQFQRF